jgi:1-acyl-sn-glycerol-3-phosphate acyltransferase
VNVVISLIRRFIRLSLPLLAGVDIVGKENLPATGGLIIAGNHLGRFDIPLIYYILDRDDSILMIAEKYQKYAIVRWMAKKMDALFVDRYNADYRTLRAVLKRLQQGELLVISPEGTRSKTGALAEARPGGSYLAAKAGIPIVPVAVTGTEDALVKAQLRHLRRLHFDVRIGTPFLLSPLEGQDRDAKLKQDTDEIMCRIAALLPPAYRGVYAGHPRLLELLSEQLVGTGDVLS